MRPFAASVDGLKQGHLGLAALQQALDDDSSGVVPQEKLRCGEVELARVDVAQQGGAEQTAAAEVEDEVDQSVEVALGDVGGDGAVDAGDGSGDVAVEQDGSLVLGDEEAAMDLGAGVAVADGPDADLVLIGGEAQALELFGQVEPGIAIGEVAHRNLPRFRGVSQRRNQCTDKRLPLKELGPSK